MNKIRVKLILELKEKGLSRSDIASSRHISRRSVNEVFKRAQELALKYSDIENKSDDDVYRIIFPNKFSNDEYVSQTCFYIKYSDYSYDLSKKLKIECVYCTRTVEFSNFPYTRKVDGQDQRLII